MSSSTVNERVPCILRCREDRLIPVASPKAVAVILFRATAARTSPATCSRYSLLDMLSPYPYLGTDATLWREVSLFDTLDGMGRTRATGPATRYIAGELRAERARQLLTLDEIETKSGVTRSTIDRMLTGRSGIPVEYLLPVCAALGIDAAKLLDAASRATE